MTYYSDFFNQLTHKTISIQAAKSLVDDYIAAGADLSVKDIHNRNAIYYMAGWPIAKNEKAARKMQVDIMAKLIENGADPLAVSNGGETALHEAANAGNADAVKLLLSHGANPKATLEPKLFATMMMPHPGGAELTQDAYHFTPLHAAAISGDMETFKLLLEQGGELNPGEGDVTSLMFANNASLAKYLIEKGADAKATTADNWSALHTAAVSGNVELIQLFIDHGANPKAANSGGFTILHAAASSGNAEAIDRVIAHGADPKAITHDGHNALHYVAYGAYA